MEPKSNAGKYIVGIIVVVLVIWGIIYTSSSSTAPATQTASSPTSTSDVSTTPTPTPTASPTSSSAKTVEVDYTNSGFSPTSVSINLGDTVNFVNKSSESMWIGSNNHPSHTLYSGTTLREHCPDTAGTAFDQCGTGDTYSFTFEKVGTWGYHNHRDASMLGTIIVK